MCVQGGELSDERKDEVSASVEQEVSEGVTREWTDSHTAEVITVYGLLAVEFKHRL